MYSIPAAVAAIAAPGGALLNRQRVNHAALPTSELSSPVEVTVSCVFTIVILTLPGPAHPPGPEGCDAAAGPCPGHDRFGKVDGLALCHTVQVPSQARLLTNIHRPFRSCCGKLQPALPPTIQIRVRLGAQRDSDSASACVTLY